MEPSGSKSRSNVSRRGLLRAGLVGGVAAASAALPLATVHGRELSQTAPTDDSHNLHQAQQPAAPSLGGFTYFTPFQAEIVNAAAGRIIPADASGPGAIEAGVVFFIDRQLSASYNFIGRRYLDGPFATGTSTQGDQSGLDMRDRYRLDVWGNPLLRITLPVGALAYHSVDAMVTQYLPNPGMLA